ncbi:PAS domain-containing protein [Gynuella sunshinyii]|uniref:histidine kinase n=1 Tax=Gynuella sunshinyii YC6258 TaxID=1445510 RepID=A0A0C5VGD2_9GAMM|nr:PAS domain-containing protein [Gynuella sunshinyii]AJQ93662.1 PAS/PAC domain [Gynuella sunshinyii YC6258]
MLNPESTWPHQLIEHLSDAIILCTPQGEIIHCNSSFALTLGYQVSDLTGQYCQKFISGDDQLSCSLKETASPRQIRQSFLHQRKHPVAFDIEIVAINEGGVETDFNCLICHPLIQQVSLPAEQPDHYINLFNKSIDAICLTREDGIIIDTNPSFCHMLGYTQDELLGQNILTLCSQQWIDHHENSLREQLRSKGYSSILEKEYIHKNGTPLSVSIRLFMETSKLTGERFIWSIARSQSDNDKLVRKLKDSEEMFRTLFDCSFDAIAYFRNDDTCELANHAFENLIGYNQQELQRLTFRDYTPPGWEDIEEQITSQVRQRGYSDVFEKEFIHKDGHIIPISLRASAQYNEHGEIIGSWLIYRDITQNRQILEELEHSKQVLEQAGRLANIGGWSYIVGTRQIRFTAEVCRILGIPFRQQASLKEMLELFSPESQSEIQASVEVTVLLRTPFDIEAIYNGFKNPRWMRLTGRIKSSSEGDIIFGVIQDIDEYKKQ